jgi:RNA-binding protein
VTLLFFERGMWLQRLGRALSLTPSQNIVVRTDKTPKIGAVVVDENLKNVGRIFDIIGPVSAPYAIVRPTANEPEKLASKQLYVILSKKERSK